MISTATMIAVAPFAGAWIEMIHCRNFLKILLESLPSRERGLKYLVELVQKGLKSVAPFAGAWIEIVSRVKHPTHEVVAPFAGAWIEIVP